MWYGLLFWEGAVVRVLKSSVMWTLLISVAAVNCYSANVDVLIDDYDSIVVAVGVPSEVLPGETIEVNVYDLGLQFVLSCSIHYEESTGSSIVSYQDGMYLWDENTGELHGFYGSRLSSRAGGGSLIVKLISKIFKKAPKPKGPSTSPNNVRPNIQRAPVPPKSIFGGMTFQDWGKNIVRWGTGAKDARDRIGTITKAEIKELGISNTQVRATIDFYKNEMIRNPGNATADARVKLMEHILSLL